MRHLPLLPRCHTQPPGPVVGGQGEEGGWRRLADVNRTCEAHTTVMAKIILVPTLSGLGQSECTLIKRVAALNTPIKGVATQL
jgi:hypothetical protein